MLLPTLFRPCSLPWTVMHTFLCINFNTYSNLIIRVLQMRKQKVRKFNPLVFDHRTTKYQI